MSVRRRAVRERVKRAEVSQHKYVQMKQCFERILELCDAKIKAGDKTFTIEELNACFPESEDA